MLNVMYVDAGYYYDLYRDDVLILNKYGYVEILIEGGYPIPLPFHQTVIISPKELCLTPSICRILRRRYMR